MTDLEQFIHDISGDLSTEKLSAADLSLLSDDDLVFLAFGSDPVMSKLAGTPQYVGQVSNGETEDPKWPEAALGDQKTTQHAVPDLTPPAPAEPKTATYFPKK